jgi:hypothetical protein
MQINFTSNEKNYKNNLESDAVVSVSENNFSIKNVVEKNVNEDYLELYDDVCEESNILYIVSVDRKRRANTIVYILKTVIDGVEYVFSLKGSEKSDIYTIEFHTAKYGYALVGKQDGLGTSFVKNIFKARNIFVEKAYELSDGKIRVLESVQSQNGNKIQDFEVKKKALLDANIGYTDLDELNSQEINVLYDKAVSVGQIDYDSSIKTVIHEGRHSAFLKLYERYFLNWNVREQGDNKIFLERKD